MVSIANVAAGSAGARVTGGGADSRPRRRLLVTNLLERNSLVIKVQTFPFERAARPTASARPVTAEASSSWCPDGRPV